MKYISGIYALNLSCDLNTCGDWHQSSLNWETVKLYNSEEMFFKDYGIQKNIKIPEHKTSYYVANHIRALLDMLEQNEFALSKGMKNDFIGNDLYTNEIFEKVYEMRKLPNWNKIDKFMCMEYFMKWVNFKKMKEIK